LSRLVRMHRITKYVLVNLHAIFWKETRNGPQHFGDWDQDPGFVFFA